MVSVGCVRHSYEPSVSQCRDCGFDYCSQCLIWPFGENEPALCRDCALVAVGVRQKFQRPTLVARETESPKQKTGATHRRPHAEMYIDPPKPLRRWWARFLDNFLPFILVSFVFWLSDAALVTTHLDPTTGLESMRVSWTGIGGIWFATFLYEAGFVFMFDGTLGKLMTGTRVVDAKTGESIGLVRSAIRAAALLVSAVTGILWLISGFMVLATDDRRTIHDHIAGSIVTFEID